MRFSANSRAFLALLLLTSHSSGQDAKATAPVAEAPPAEGSAKPPQQAPTQAEEAQAPAAAAQESEANPSEGSTTKSAEPSPQEQESPPPAASTSEKSAETKSIEEQPKEVEPTPAAPEAAAAAPQEPTEASDDDDYSQLSSDDLVPAKSKKSKLILGIGIDLSLPIGETAKFISSVSLQGFSLDVRYFAWDNWGIGAQIAFNSFSEKTSDPLDWEGYVFNAVQVREQSFMPIAVKGVYAWRDEEKFIPYVAAGLGASRTVQRVQVGWSELSQPSWHFLMIPEVGGYVPIGPTVLFANARLNYLPPGGGQSSQFYGNLTIGVTVQ